MPSHFSPRPQFLVRQILTCTIIGLFCGFKATTDYKVTNVKKTAFKNSIHRDSLKIDSLEIIPCGLVPIKTTQFRAMIALSRQDPDDYILKVVESLLEESGMHLNNSNRNFLLEKTDVLKNVVAYSTPVIHNEKYLSVTRHIAYGESFINELKNNSSEAVLYAVFAHEISHHLYGDNFMKSEQTEDRRQRELSADSFAGFLCYRMGLKLGFKLEDCTVLYELIDKMESDPEEANGEDQGTHPGKDLRIQTFTNGWNNSKAYMDISCRRVNFNALDPFTVIEGLTKESSSLVKRTNEQYVATLVSANVTIDSLTALKSIESVVNLRGDSAVFLVDNTRKLTTVEGQELNSVEGLVKKSDAKKGGTANQYLVDKKAIIWATYPNGVPYVAGTVQTIKK